MLDAATRAAMLRRAGRELRLGNLSGAEGICRQVLDLQPDCAEAAQLLAQVVGRFALPVYSPGPRYLLIKAWGFGFWSDVSHVLAGLLLAELTGRIPVTHWAGNSLFSDGTERDAFACFFEPVSEVTADFLVREGPEEIYPARWGRTQLLTDDPGRWQPGAERLGAIYFLHRPEPLLVNDFHLAVIDLLPWIPPGHPLHGQSALAVARSLAAKYLRPRSDILAEVEAFAQRHLADPPVVAVHVRGSDKKQEVPNLAEINLAYEQYLDRLSPETRVLLLTDDTREAAKYRERFGARLILTESQRTSTDQGRHYQPSTDRVALGREVLIDTLLALRCEAFLGNGASNVSAVVEILKEWPPGRCTLLGTSSILQRNLFVFLRP